MRSRAVRWYANKESQMKGERERWRGETTKCAGSGSDDDCEDPFYFHHKTRQEKSHRINVRRKKNVKTFTIFTAFAIRLRVWVWRKILILVYASFFSWVLNVIVPNVGETSQELFSPFFFYVNKNFERKVSFCSFRFWFLAWRNSEEVSFCFARKLRRRISMLKRIFLRSFQDIFTSNRLWRHQKRIWNFFQRNKISDDFLDYTCLSRSWEETSFLEFENLFNFLNLMKEANFSILKIVPFKFWSL